MTIFSALGVVAMLIGIFGSGEIALFAFLTGGLFCSIHVAVYIFFEYYGVRKIHISGLVIFSYDDFRWCNHTSSARKACGYFWNDNFLLGSSTMFCFSINIFNNYKKNFEWSKINLNRWIGEVLLKEPG